MPRKPPTRSKRPLLPKVPSQTEMRTKAELWLDFFHQMLDLRIDHGDADVLAAREIETASMLADDALNAFEKRWPMVKLKG